MSEDKELIKIKAKEYYLKNKEKILARRKLYRETYPDRIKEYNKNNKVKNQERKAKWVENNSDHIKEYNKEYIKANSDKRKEYAKEYRKNNKGKIREYFNNLRNSNDLVKLIDNTRRMIRYGFVSKGFQKTNKTELILGCSFNEFKVHIESLWEDWMNWDNYGNPKDGILELDKSWDIDHIIPLSTAKTEEDVVRLNHYTNQRPLCSYTNRYIKRNSIK